MLSGTAHPKGHSLGLIREKSDNLGAKSKKEKALRTEIIALKNANLRHFATALVCKEQTFGTVQ